jgi:hypothetical protein
VLAATPRAALARPVRKQRASSRRSSPRPCTQPGLVAGFVAHPHHGIAWELDPQPGRDLHWRPPFGQPAADPLGGAGHGSALGSWAAWPAAGRAGGPATPGTGPGRRRRRPPATPWRSPSRAGRRSRPRTVRHAPQRDLLPVCQRQPPRPWHPAVLADRPPRAPPRDQRHPLMRAAHLRPDLPQRQAAGLQPQRQPPLLCRQLCRHRLPPRSNQRILADSPRQLRRPPELARIGLG